MSDKTRRLSEVFANLKITQKKFAEMLESDVSTVNQLLAGTRTIGPNVSNKICLKLGLNPTWWETGEGEMYLPKESSQELVNDSEEVLLLRQLVQTQQQLIETQAELLEERRKQDRENKNKS